MDYFSNRSNRRNLCSLKKSPIRKKKDFLKFFDKLQAQADIHKTIKDYKELFQVKVDIKQEFYEYILLNLCALLKGTEQYGEELYYRLLSRLHFDSMLAINKHIIQVDGMEEAFNKVVRDLNQARQQLNVLVFDTEMESYRNIADIIRIACAQSVYIYRDEFTLRNLDDCFRQNIHAVIFCAMDDSYTLEFSQELKSLFPAPVLHALYFSFPEQAKELYRSQNNRSDYYLFNDKMIYAFLHMVLLRLRSTPIGT